MARALHQNPQTRHLLRAMPNVARRTVGSIAKQAAKGRPVSPRTAVRTLALQTKKVLGTPVHRAQALRQHNVLERRFHTLGRGMIRPHAPLASAGQRRVASTPHPAVATSVPARTGVRYGRIVGGQCVCSACPSCGVAAPGIAAPGVAVNPAPAYCRCCGQVLR